MPDTPTPSAQTGPRRYRKRSVEIEAWQLTEDADWEAVAAWCGGVIRVGRDITDEAYSWLVIPTLEGDMRGNEGDFIIRGVRGEFYPCKPDIFAVTHEPIPAAITEADAWTASDDYWLDRENVVSGSGRDLHWRAVDGDTL